MISQRPLVRVPEAGLNPMPVAAVNRKKEEVPEAEVPEVETLVTNRA